MSNNPTAFPMQDPQAIHAYAAAKVEGITDTAERDRVYILARAEAVGGMTLRDWFAGQALQGMLANQHPYQAGDEYMFSRDAFKLADAMLKAREGGAA